jgi:hypothetical protein
LLVFAAAVSFRSLRDAWVMAIVAATILASKIGASRIEGRERAANPLPKFAIALAGVAAALAVWAGFRVMHVNNDLLAAKIAKTLPVGAVDAIRARSYPGPLYNDFTWGGYLIWALRMPVSIDGRAAFYGDKALDRSYATWSAEPDWASDPALTSAGVVIGPVKSPLMQVLRRDPRFQLAYEDKVAAVFIPHR